MKSHYSEVSDSEEEDVCPEAVESNEAGEHSCETAEGSNEQEGPSNDIGLLNQKKELRTRNSTKQGQGTERLHSRAPGKLFPFLTCKL